MDDTWISKVWPRSEEHPAGRILHSCGSGQSPGNAVSLQGLVTIEAPGDNAFGIGMDHSFATKWG